MTTSAVLPVKTERIIFSRKIEGSYGTFRTYQSFETAFLVATLPMARIEELGTASEAFPISEVDFEDLVQRDIDMDRVTTIQKDYLQETVNKVVFFPPLLVAVMPYDQPSGSSSLSIPSTYASFREEVKDGWIEKTWDETRFQVRLPIAPNETGLTATCSGATYPIYPYGAELKLNPDRTRLVVIDGQHRLSALRGLYRNSQTRHIVANIDIPICVIYSPNALSNSTLGESLKDDLRELFVTINNKAHKVSGHFIILLDDDTLTSLAVRSLAQKWKEEETPQGFSKLHLLDWNQRRTELAQKRTKQISITTVSIIAHALEREIFSSENNNPLGPASFLNLDSVREELEELAPEYPVDQIRDESFHPKQKKILESQLLDTLTPALDWLLLAPRPYREHQDRVANAMRWLDAKVADNIEGAKAYRDEILANFRSATNSLEQVKTIEKTFLRKCEPPATDTIFFLNVFQDALVSVWCEVTREALAFDISPLEAAKLTVCALDPVCFGPDPRLLRREQPFTTLSLYRTTGSVMFNQPAREQWRRLLAVALTSAPSIAIIRRWCVERLSEHAGMELTKRIEQYAESAKEDFFYALERAIQKDLEKAWFDRQIDPRIVKELEDIRERHGAQSPEMKAAIADKVTAPRLAAAKEALDEVLKKPA